MAYPGFYGGYQSNYYQSPIPDQLAQLRGQQFQAPMQGLQIPPQTQMGSQSMVWVSGEQEAMNYLVAPNSAVALWDSNNPTIYLKQADASGKPSIKIYDLVERTHRPAQVPQTSAVEYAPLSRLEALEARLNAMTEHKEVKEDTE